MFLSKKALQKAVHLFPIDFTKPWWSLITDQKWLFIRITVLTSLANLFWHMMPFIIGYMFELSSVSACVALLAAWILIDTGNVYARQLNAQFQLQCIHSIYHSAHQYLLTVDPRYHVHRSSGSILGKIERGARGYEEILDQITFDFVPLAVGLLVMIIALSRYSLLLAFSIACFFIIMIVFAYYFARYFCHTWEKEFIATDDSFRQTAVENLAQVHLVRASFASDYMSDKLRSKIVANMKAEGGLWLSYTTTSFILNAFHAVSVFALVLVLTQQVRAGSTTLVSAIGLTIAYIQCTKALTMITKPFRRYMRGWTAVKDLFDCIPHFGKQGYPVLGDRTPATKDESEELTLHAHDITFNYETASLFNGHTLTLKCDKNHSNKLYGIIGASGKGKTTLLQILGGQLKPLAGTVTINGIDIYTVNDRTRRQLIALQGQIATTVRGTVRYNLFFGLPHDHTFTDHDLRAVLEKVGLWKVLAAYDGLETMLGEGGLNFSGGQRQRLNFAGLYLRATFYKPALILIDEPTSSLDEMSEHAITHMITQLAESAVTLVIAHRLKTIEKAAGLIDFSLLDDGSEISAYTSEELATRSAYYAHLQHRAHEATTRAQKGDDHDKISSSQKD